jgi:hypothetical protein
LYTRQARHQHNSSIIGWISSTDVMMLGMILMFALALFLQAKYSQSQADRSRLHDQCVSLNSQLLLHKNERNPQALVKAQYEDLLARFEAMKRDREQERVSHDANVDALTERTNALTDELARLKTSLVKTLAIVESGKAEALRKDAELALLRDNARLLDEAKSSLVHLRERTAELEHMLAEIRVDQRKINRDLIGLRGILSKTVILVDASGSMAGDRWKDAVEVMAIWFEQLPVREVNLIVFNAQPNSFPGASQFLRLDGPEGESHRKRLIDHLKAITPTGGTFTRAALQQAYASPGIDSIILFTDGAPNTGKEADPVQSEADAIYALINDHKDIPINAIGVGEYFDPRLSAFLLKVGELSHGTFIGR